MGTVTSCSETGTFLPKARQLTMHTLLWARSVGFTILPPVIPQLIYFGVGNINGQLVIMDPSNAKRTKKVYSFVEQTRKEIIPPMPTARNSATVLSLQSILLVAGGVTGTNFTSMVELFKSETFQWYETHSLPTPCMLKTLVVSGNICYALGGMSNRMFNEALQVSVDELVEDAVIVKNSSHKTLATRSDQESAWKDLPNTPSYRPAAAVVLDSRSLIRNWRI